MKEFFKLLKGVNVILNCEIIWSVELWLVWEIKMFFWLRINWLKIFILIISVSIID